MQTLLQSKDITLEYSSVDENSHYFVNKSEVVRICKEKSIRVFEAINEYNARDMYEVVNRIMQLEFDSQFVERTFTDLAEYHGVSGAIIAGMYVYVKDNSWINMDVECDFCCNEELEEICREAEFYSYEEVFTDLI